MSAQYVILLTVKTSKQKGSSVHKAKQDADFVPGMGDARLDYMITTIRGRCGK